MPDWKKLVRERLGSSVLPPEDREQVISELAAHLDETWEAARAEGLTETESEKRALQEIGDWHVLGKNIQRATRAKEQPMNQRTKSLWLPALANFAATTLFLLVLTQVSLAPRYLVRLNSGLGVSLYAGWLVAQLLFGALGAFLSRRAGGTRAARIVAATFPAIILFGLWAFWIPVSAVLEHNAFFLRHPLYYAVGIFIWVVPPGMALFLGAAPFLGEARNKPEMHQA
jgi:hypothetical protein